MSETWTRFMDMHSGGGSKEDFQYLLIEAPQDEATAVFYARFGHNPSRVTCSCCGEDYSIGEDSSIANATAYDRGLRYAEDERGWLYGKDRPNDYRGGQYLEPGEPVPSGMRVRECYRDGEGVALADFLADPAKYHYRIIRADEITEAERESDVPEQGYVWHD